MSRQSTTKKPNENTVKQTKVQPVKIPPKAEEKPSDRISENDINDSTAAIVEKPIDKTAGKQVIYKWIVIVVFLLLIAGIILYLELIKANLLDKKSRDNVTIAEAIGLLMLLVIWYIPRLQVEGLREIPLEVGEKKFDREKECLKLEDDKRKTMAQIIGGVLLILGLLVTYNTYYLGVKQQEINSRGQVSERFSKAVEHLGNQDLTIRLGGLYSLEQILDDSPQDHQIIIEVLSSYIADKAKKVSADSKPNNPSNSTETPVKSKISTEVQIALIILGRQRQQKTNVNLINLDLNSADLSYASLGGANFSNTDLSKADLSETNLRYANLRGANLSDVNLNKTNLNGVDLTEIVFLRSNQLEKAEFDYIYIGEKQLDRESALKYFREKEAENNK